MDEFTGGAGNDTFNAVLSSGATNTLDGLDILNGGDGTDTLKIVDDTGNQTIPGTFQLSNVETVTVRSVGTANIDLTGAGISGVTTLSSTQSVAATLEAADTTDINVSGATGAITVVGGKDVTVTDSKADTNIDIGDGTDDPAGTITVTDSKQGTGTIDIDGGTDVTVDATVTLANASAPITGGTIKVGTATEATGAVVIDQTLTSDATDSLTGGAITVDGGTTVDITSTATQNAKDKNATGETVTFGAVDVTSDGNTTSVNVTQAYSEQEVSKVNAVTVKSTVDVTFKAMAKNDTVTVNGLTFTASKALTAGEVAQAFSNLTLADIQSENGPTSNGFYTGTFNTTTWTTGTANGATVPFTGSANGIATPALSATSSGTVPTPTASNYEAGSFTALVPATANAVTYGTVAIDEDGTADASIETITLDGYNTATLGAGASLDALTALSLTNSTAATTLTTTATALDLTLNKVTGAATVNLGTTVTALDVTTTGSASSVTLQAANTKDLVIDAGAKLTVAGNVGNNADALQTVDINGTAAVVLGTLPTGSTNLKTFDASGNTGGVTATINANATTMTEIDEYVFSGGADTVTINNSTVSVDVTLGAGNDKVTLAAGTTAPSKTIDGGADTDTLVMDAADADTASGSTTFATKVVNFENLTLQNNTAGTVSTQTTTLTFTDDNLSAGDQIAFDITGLTADINVAQPFDTDWATTLGAIATTIQGNAEITTATVVGNTIVIVGNDGITYTVGAETTTDQDTALTTNTVAEDVGTNEYTITFTENTAMDGGDSIQLNADGTAINEVFDTDWATTLGKIAAAIALDADIASATVNGNAIDIVAAAAGNALTIDGFAFTDAGAASDVTAVIAETVAIESTATITLVDGAGNAAMAEGDEIEVVIGGTEVAPKIETGV